MSSHSLAAPLLVATGHIVTSQHIAFVEEGVVIYGRGAAHHQFNDALQPCRVADQDMHLPRSTPLTD